MIRKLKKKDTGNYGCNATNSLGYVYKDVYVNVLALPPEITEPPRQEATVDGRTISMICRVFGAPKPEVKWIRNGLELTGGRYKVQENGDLMITQVGFADAGNYTCHAVNKFGTKEASGSLAVKEHTRITDEPIDYEVAAGNPATFRCNAVADSALDLQIKWLNDGEEIDFENEPRFLRTNDNSLTISKTAELDSGVYICVASTDLDEARAQATLIVQDVPNPPRLKGVRCNSHDAAVSWEPLGDNRAPILHYTIQYNTSFTPDSWEVAFDKIPATDFTYTVAMSPWANYTFRILAFNKIGTSLPSGHSEQCSTQADVPFKNPDNVEGKGTKPDNLVISWTHMPQIEHNAPHFQYRVYWKRDVAAEKWNTEDIYDWEQSNILISGQPTFQRYRIKVVAINEMGESNMAAKEVIGYSGEDTPTDFPLNFTMLQVTGSTSAVLSWNPVPPESVRGHFKGYKIQTWTENDSEDNYREIHVKGDSGDSSKALVTKFTPDAINYARVLVYNSRFNGPPSATIDFKTPEGVPSSVQSFEAFPLGSSALWLTWKKPLQPNGQLTGYKIYSEKVNGTKLEAKVERKSHINDPRIFGAKLGLLEPNTKYRLHIAATTKAGEGEDFFIEQKTSALAGPPDVPNFSWEGSPSENNLACVKVIWRPSLDGKPGSHFFVKYRLKGESIWERKPDEEIENYQTIRGLKQDSIYEFVVVAVDGDYQTESAIQDVSTYGNGKARTFCGLLLILFHFFFPFFPAESIIKVPSENVATAGWFIGMMLAIVFLLLLLILICIIKRNRGGKYDVHDRELANGRRDYNDEGGFHEYSQPYVQFFFSLLAASKLIIFFGKCVFRFRLDNKSAGRQSVASNLTKPDHEDDADSMAEYGEGDTGKFGLSVCD